METAMFGAGCFWGVEAAFRQTAGVKSTAVGYAGGHSENPTYKEVCTDRTGHAEVVFVEFDPKTVTYADLLDVFWNCHNPTTLNRQGPDFGSPIPLGDLLCLARTTTSRRGIQKPLGSLWEIPKPRGDGNYAGSRISQGGRVPSAIPGKTRPIQLPPFVKGRHEALPTSIF